MIDPRLREIGNMVLVGLGVAVLLASEAPACGRDSDCPLGDRNYRIALPEGQETATPSGAVIFVHGYRGKASGAMRNQALAALASELGVVFVAAQAAGPEWNLPGAPSVDALQGVDELAYFDALVADLTRRFGIPPGRTMVTGFSSGAMMVWHLACYRGEIFAGLAPMSGTFWEPIPSDCPAHDFNLIHYHGREDPVVPLHGRQIKDAHQGDILKAVELAQRLGEFRPVASEPSPGLDCARQSNAGGNLLELCLFTGKHQLKAQHIARAWRIFMAVAPE